MTVLASPAAIYSTDRQLDLLVTCLIMVSCLAYSSTMKMEATYSIEMSVDFQRTTRRYIAVDI
jgi:hypothetical protein